MTKLQMSNYIEFVGSLPVVKNPIEIPVFAPISKSNREIILAYSNYPKVSEYTDKNFVGNKVTEYIGVTFFYVGIKAENMHSKDLMLYYQTVVRDIYNDFSDLTIKEIELAFHMGVRGQLGEFHGINPATFYKWLKTFCQTVKLEARKEHKALAATKEEPKEKIFTEEEKNRNNQIWCNDVLNAYDRFIETNNYSFRDMGGLLYKRLFGNPEPMYKFSFSQCKQIWKRACVIVKANYAPPKARTEGQRNDFMQIREFLTRSIGFESVKNLVKSNIKREFERLAVIMYWANCKKNNFDFKKEFLERKKKYEKTRKNDSAAPENKGLQSAAVRG